jgi:hypothetical protein
VRAISSTTSAIWRSGVARKAHNLKVPGSKLGIATFGPQNIFDIPLLVVVSIRAAVERRTKTVSPEKIGTRQRKLAWSLCKGDAEKSSMYPFSCIAVWYTLIDKSRNRKCNSSINMEHVNRAVNRLTPLVQTICRWYLLKPFETF